MFICLFACSAVTFFLMFYFFYLFFVLPLEQKKDEAKHLNLIGNRNYFLDFFSIVNEIVEIALKLGF